MTKQAVSWVETLQRNKRNEKPRGNASLLMRCSEPLAGSQSLVYATPDTKSEGPRVTISLQQAIDQAGSPVDLLWKPNPAPWAPPVVKPEYAGWSAEQAAWREAVTLSDLSHHMSDLFIKGPDALRLISDFGVNDFGSFAIGQAKQFVPVTEEGYLIADGILMRNGEESFTLTGNPASQNWLRYNAQKGRYDVELATDPVTGQRPGGGDPVLFRYQVQGPRALALVEKVFGGPLPKTKFFHSVDVSFGGRPFRALRHGMAEQPGYEFIGDFKLSEHVKKAFIAAGEEFGLVLIGAKAYSTNGIESGWVAGPTPGIYSAPGLRGYRDSLNANGYEGHKPLHGSHYSTRMEDYYYSPYEIDYGKIVSLNHDFYGRAALEEASRNVTRKKVVLELDDNDARKHLGTQDDFFVTYGRYRIETGDKMIGLTSYTGRIAPIGKVLALSVVDIRHAEPGSRVSLVWGEHPGRDTKPEAVAGFARIGATVRPSPYNDYARTQYRKSA